MSNVLLFSGSSNKDLAASIGKHLGIKLGQVDLTRFADGEQRPWIRDDVRDKTVFVLQSFSQPIDEYVMELALMGDAISRSAPKTMIAVIPYMGYARQDKQNRSGEPISARVVAKFLEVSKFQEVITVDMHNDAIVGFFQIPVTHLTALSVLAHEVSSHGIDNGIVVSPDVGGVRRARNLAYELDLSMVVMEKRRYLDRHDKSESFQIIGEVEGRHAIIIDDIMSTGGTIADASKSLKAAGAAKITVLCSHAVLSGDAKETLEKSAADEIIVTNSIALPVSKQFGKLRVAPICELLADAIEKVMP